MCSSYVSILALLGVGFGLGEELDSAPVEPLLVTEPPQIFLRTSSVSVSSHLRFPSWRWECLQPHAGFGFGLDADRLRRSARVAATTVRSGSVLAMRMLQGSFQQPYAVAGPEGSTSTDDRRAGSVSVWATGMLAAQQFQRTRSAIPDHRGRRAQDNCIQSSRYVHGGSRV